MVQQSRRFEGNTVEVEVPVNPRIDLMTAFEAVYRSSKRIPPGNPMLRKVEQAFPPREESERVLRIILQPHFPSKSSGLIPACPRAVFAIGEKYPHFDEKISLPKELSIVSPLSCIFDGEVRYPTIIWTVGFCMPLLVSGNRSKTCLMAFVEKKKVCGRRN